ncbi:MAG TPA: DUF72 domain-containing protein [Burkholderiales bacterium]|nr:DUF72 domain-containing protein [Burkholderiales bacterium]
MPGDLGAPKRAALAGDRKEKRNSVEPPRHQAHQECRRKQQDAIFTYDLEGKEGTVHMKASRLSAGASGYSYKEWKGHFYPEDIKPDAMLAWYAGRLPTVEINNTFYRMPKTEVVENWAKATPENFRFAIKAPRRITHDMRLKADEAADSVALPRTCSSGRTGWLPRRGARSACISCTS